MSERILLVEDDPTIVESLTELLTSEGYVVDQVARQDDALTRVLGEGATPARAVAPAGSPGSDGTAHRQHGFAAPATEAHAGRQANSAPYALVLLDVTLAQGNGFAVCNTLKHEMPQLPIIFLTASDDEFTTVAGIQMGADDYIAKPFRPRELLARIDATIRRSRTTSRVIALGPLTIDTDRAHVERRGAEVVLSALEYRLLLLFATNAGKLVTREAIRDALWDDAGTYIEENTLSVYIKRLRNKIEDEPAHPQIIVTVRGLGYKAMG